MMFYAVQFGESGKYEKVHCFQSKSEIDHFVVVNKNANKAHYESCMKAIRKGAEVERWS